MDYVQQCPQPTLCWVFADKEGHIGMQGCGRFPIRGNGHVGLAPIPAWDEANHWAPGWLDRKHLPRVYDPPEGFVATANEEINTPGLPMMMTQPLPDYRRRRIVQRLRQLTAATPEDMRVLQYDLVSLQALELLEVFLPHLPDGELKDRLRDWDGSYAPESVEAPLFQKLYRFVMMELLGHEQRIGWRRMLYLCSRAGFSMMVLTAADRVLLRDDSVWWRGTNKGDMIRRAAAKLNLDHLERWSDVNNFHFTDRFFGNHQVGRMLGFNSRRYPMPGNHATIFQGHVLQTATREQTFSPSYHFVTDMGTDEAWTNLPGGPSESRFSRYYRSDVGRWLTGEYKRLSGHAT
jgi:penicillin amidase